MSTAPTPVHSSHRLDLASASRIAEVALAQGRRLQLKPLTVAVLDAGGHLLAFVREDGCGILRPQIAIGKAWGALGMGMGGRALAERAQAHPGFYTALAAASDGRMLPVAGGVLVRNAQSDIVGAVGISGDLPDQDEHCALAGIDAAGWHGDPG
ncbi:GlcG/HbpS family heme-binding protein [Variovorax boronicumulans]|uniref:GlcG/HbpS family heme-binding protein n=1 Tax=Variovorax boronicumulans TaxID=436515 RepID=UPI001C58ABCB